MINLILILYLECGSAELRCDIAARTIYFQYPWHDYGR